MKSKAQHKGCCASNFVPYVAGLPEVIKPRPRGPAITLSRVFCEVSAYFSIRFAGSLRFR